MSYGQWVRGAFYVQGAIEHSDELKLAIQNVGGGTRLIRLTLWHNEIFLTPEKARELARGLLEWASPTGVDK